MREKLLAIAERLDEAIAEANFKSRGLAGSVLGIIAREIRAELQDDTETMSDLCERIEKK